MLGLSGKGRGGGVGGIFEPKCAAGKPRTAQVVPRKEGRAQKEQNVWGSLSVCLLEWLLYAQILMSWGYLQGGIRESGSCWLCWMDSGTDLGWFCLKRDCLPGTFQADFR